ncbi:suc1-sucrose proton symporter [Tieghemostelium lacteum]|uniref:Suc1-sucrose proton symporter n=1 Tax=Tieghemostelium lacteum TaxID=361077 RepID=A0A151ZBJ2_TIELA|nr:suc1-sucrose proton symporter [Tieghemostelium lacteum]|eukprot:KYQ91309.1 suc1-sucrose proton symporter [Tieghemostelium lacteum]
MKSKYSKLENSKEENVEIKKTIPEHKESDNLLENNINSIFIEDLDEPKDLTDVEKYLISNQGSLQINSEQIINDSYKKEISIFKLIVLSLSFLGVQFGWALQIAYSTPLFLELGVSKFWVSFIWIAGPVSGLIVQPIVGVLSDRSESKFGRRKPYIFFGTIFIVVGLLLISNAQSLGSLLGDSKDTKKLSIFFAIIGFWVLDLSNNAVQGPCRALLVDVASPSQQGLGSSLFSIMLGFGNLLGYLMGSLRLSLIFPFLKTDIRALFTLSILVLIFCIFFTLICIQEKKFSRINANTENPFSVLFKGILRMPPYLKRLCCVQFFSWIGWFSFILFATTWVGVNVYGGNPDAPEGTEERERFQLGVRIGSLGLTFSSLLNILISFLIPLLFKLVGIKIVYFVGTLIQAVTFLLFFFLQSKIAALVLITFTGIPWSIVMIVPFAIVGLGANETQYSTENSGLQIGILNIFIVLPQLLVAVGISFVIEIFNGNVAYSLLTGSISSFIATLLIFRIIIPQDRIEEIRNSPPNSSNVISPPNLINN